MSDDDWKVLIEGRIADLKAASDASREDRDPVELDQTRQGRLSRMDAMQGQAMAQASEARRTQQIARLKAALARLERGEFGECLACGEAIASARLRNDPSATLCIDCAGAREDRG
ncbi:TraR/DksA family transcriptional regulator [Wenzhouxiangella sp. XN79A]|uniref:TraR/DksA family transcriptional regulator n=1 Tax=Wenzhouxiangella sp. XN79A TaxID=2724193 RepID=UPI00144A4E97|nr:TraR/DksA C4-type zinc finger protein [Wenzhouxiangella sp. XN79A]NKI34644.1 TraR/DksA family transcriptional regulator [Wenzhouxiangella sp. XN79A]